jgi:hypothetical protein
MSKVAGVFNYVFLSNGVDTYLRSIYTDDYQIDTVTKS